jgi:hypothetical protein
MTRPEGFPGGGRGDPVQRPLGATESRKGEVTSMTGEVKCLFFRDTEDSGFDCGFGYCDLDFDRTVCGGHVEFCERPDVLRRYLIQQKKKWEGRKSARV